MESRGVDWWGYVEGDVFIVGLLVACTIVFAVAFLARRLMPSGSSNS